MSLLQPVTTVVLIMLGLFCMFTAINHDRKLKEKLQKVTVPITKAD